MDAFAFFPTFFGMICFVVWTVITGWQRRQRLKVITEFNTRLLDRLGSVKDFSEFIQTETGSQFMRGLTSEPVTTVPEQRILNAVQIGLVCLSLGLGLLFLSRVVTSSDVPSRVHDVLMVFGTVAASIGGGFLLSSGVSYRLALALGLLKRVEK